MHHKPKINTPSGAKLLTAAIWGALTVAVTLPVAQAQEVPEVSSPPHALSTVSVPSVPNISDFIRNKELAIVLGKALFWDMGVGSDGMSCASCHFHAGADNRVKNQLSPGLLEENGPDTTFQSTASGGQGGPNYKLVKDDFPFIQFNDMNNRHSGMTFQTNDAASSQGAFLAQFQNIPSVQAVRDECAHLGDPIFHVGGTQVRQVEPRNTPSMINAVFNFRNFWDGRANNVFNGVDPFGKRNNNAVVFDRNGNSHTVDLRNSSLASQASGPPLSTLEMSCAQRAFADIGQKLLPRKALSFQQVDANDSVLGSLRHTSGRGLTYTYKKLVKKAFKTKWWYGNTPYGANGQYNLMERNFSLFFGLALQEYQSTLISDDAPYDRFAEYYHANDLHSANQQISESARRGLDVFLNKGKCINCHSGPEFSGAASELFSSSGSDETLVERMLMGDNEVALYDSGFYNIGVTPTSEDLGVGANDPFGNPLSFSKQFRDQNFVDPISVDTCKFEVPFDTSTSPSTDIETTTYLDKFTAYTYSNNYGTGQWNGDWDESDSWKSATGGYVRISGKRLRLRNTGSYAQRAVDLSGAFSASLKFDWRTLYIESTDEAYVEISSDNGASWSVLEKITGISGTNTGTKTYDISAHASAHTVIRFRLNKYYKYDYFYVDNFEVSKDVEVPGELTSNCDVLPSDLSTHRLAVRGAFKTPILRNVELTGPYMHNGSLATLEQVVQFYNRGGNLGSNNPELDPDIRSLGLTDQEQADLVAFMKSLTDERVAMEKAPFDRPQLIIPHGHPGDENAITATNGTLPAPFFTVSNGAVVKGAEAIELPAVGAHGRNERLQSFEQTLERVEPNLATIATVASGLGSNLDAVNNLSVRGDALITSQTGDLITFTWDETKTVDSIEVYWLDNSTFNTPAYGEIGYYISDVNQPVMATFNTATGQTNEVVDLNGLQTTQLQVWVEGRGTDVGILEIIINGN